MTRFNRLSLIATSFLALAQLASSCLITEDRCDENQVRVSSSLELCECVDGAVPDPRGYGCMKCGANEAAEANKCVCKPGYARPSAEAACEEVEGVALGEACEESSECADLNPYCASSGEEKFCTTSGCTNHAACPNRWRCDRSQAESFCTKPPDGLEKMCARPEDCAGTEATFCDTFFSSKCYVEMCANGTNACPSGYACCDFTAVAATSVCVPAEGLNDGLCLDGKAPVTP